MGDSSDNIPGVRGIGEKGAQRLLAQYGSLDEVYRNLDQIGGNTAEKLRDGEESAFFSRELATIRRDAPIGVELDTLTLKPLGLEAGKLFARYGFKAHLARVEQQAPAEEPEKAETVCETAGTGDEIAAFIREAQAAGSLALWRTEKELYAALSARRQIRIPFRMTLLDDGVDESEAWALFKAPLEDEKIEKVLYDGKAWLHALDTCGIQLKNLAFDVLIAAYLLDPAGVNLQFGMLCRANGVAEDAAALFALRADMQAQLDRAEMAELFSAIEMPLVSVLYQMEKIGFAVDGQALTELGREMGETIIRLTEEIYELAGGAFNINSPRQLGDVLFEKLNLPHGKKTKVGYSTSAEVLEKLEGVHPIIGKILEFRKWSKLKSTYVDAFDGLLDAAGRVHTSFNQAATATGRLSSSAPNLQNIPVRTEEGREIRRLFHAGEGMLLVDADYSQIELRVLAHISGDETLMQAFCRGDDIHRLTAAKVFGVAEDEVTGEMRGRAKAVNFGIIYGISDFGLARQTGIGRKEAEAFIEKYLTTYPGVRAYMENIVQSAREDGSVRTLFGRRRTVEGINAANFNTRSFAERVAMNTPIQGTAADIIKVAMVEVDRALREGGYKARLILQVHDELIIEAPEEEADAIAALLKQVMESAMSLSVPLVADVHTGKSWYDTK